MGNAFSADASVLTSGPVSEPAKAGDSPYRRAFINQYNAILLGAAGLFALATFSWLPLAIGAGLEILWMTFVPDSGVFRRWLGMQKSREAQEQLAQETEAIL